MAAMTKSAGAPTSLRPAQRASLRASTTHSRRGAALVVRADQKSLLPYWGVQWKELSAAKVMSVEPSLAKDMADSGDYVLLDVRPVEDFEKAHPVGAISVPLFTKIGFGDLNGGNWLKALAYASNGVAPVEMNPKFADDVKAAADGKNVLVLCEAGGTMKPSVNFPTGKESRSLKSAYRILNEKLAPSVSHVEGGCFGWFQAGLEFEGEYDTSNVGRTPSAASEPTGFSGKS